MQFQGYGYQPYFGYVNGQPIEDWPPTASYFHFVKMTSQKPDKIIVVDGRYPNFGFILPTGGSYDYSGIFRRHGGTQQSQYMKDLGVTRAGANYLFMDGHAEFSSEYDLENPAQRTSHWNRW